MTPAGWVALWCQVLLLSLLQFGGAITVAPALHQLLVQQLGLLTDAQFTSSVAIAQASPGPNTLYVAVAGYQVAGLAGALAGQLAILLPSSLLTVAVARWGDAPASARAMSAFKAGMAPITIALLFSTSWVLVSSAPGWRQAFLAAASAAVVWRTRVHLLWLIAAGALLGALGVV
jgi:chromate transporter